MFSFGGTETLPKATEYLNRLKDAIKIKILERYAREGVDALSSATPVRSGKTASSWVYEINVSGSTSTIDFLNTNVNKGVNIAIILQTGHGTGTGGYVAGRDYINPAIQPVFDRLAESAWREVGLI